jgi:hypothetical protein
VTGKPRVAGIGERPSPVIVKRAIDATIVLPLNEYATERRLKHSDDHNYHCGDDCYNCEKNIQEINHGDVIYVVFHGGAFLSTSIRSPKLAS